MDNSYTRFMFFTGKGGVGKTSLSCAYAIKFAILGKKVLLVSTDPASNLKDVLHSQITDKISKVTGLENLFAINIDPETSAIEYRNRVISPLKDVLKSEDIKKINEELSGACTTEIASFDEFSRFISDETEASKFDIIIFDTAPTGHTLRLLELPAAWSEFVENNPSGASCLCPASALKNNKKRYNTVVSKLRDPKMATFYLVARPDQASLVEASRTSDELKQLGMNNQKLLVNGIFKSLDKSYSFAMQIENISQKQLNSLPSNLKELKIETYPLLPYNVLGIEKLQSLMDENLQRDLIDKNILNIHVKNTYLKGINELAEDITSSQSNGLILTMGKGGVGKTLVASALAILIAKKGFEVHLTTTDPSGNVKNMINQLSEIPLNLTIDKIDPKLETQIYVNKIMLQKGKNLDDHGKNLLLEDLKSPCTEEVAVFHAFSKAIHEAKRKFVIIDTAPTGHTLLLLDTAGSYHREVLKNTEMDPLRIKTPYMALQDKKFSKIILVTLPETTPMREAMELQSDLNRAGISIYSWVINQSLSMNKDLKDPILRSRALSEIEIIEQIKVSQTNNLFGIPFIIEEKILPALLDLSPAL